ncbi:hypothetical protein ACQPYK_05575 [Streptosporangium sp. CA-135522]|uniref:hypothetical protein n=1 Tax=Streptosporangium sp. CA-135522 TaxID=3240072 RepID=UPI003D916869
MSLLEERYRYVLRLLPASYRAEREEEMVCAFLEGSGGLRDEDNPRPRWSEIASVVALSVRVRLGGSGAPLRSLAWGEAVRLTATLGLFFHAMMACVYFGSSLEIYGIFGTGDPTLLGAAGSPERLWDIAQGVGGLLWVAAFASLVLGRTRAAKASALLAVALYYGSALRGEAVRWDEGTKALILHGVLYVVPVLALLAGFHRDAPRTHRPRWVAALPVGAGAPLYVILKVLNSMALAPVIDLRFWSWVWPWLGELGLACLALVVASVTCVGTRMRAPGGRTASLPLALAILTVPVTLVRAADLTFQAVDPITRTMEAVNAGQLAALLVCGVTLVVLGVRALPPLPRPVPSSP